MALTAAERSARYKEKDPDAYRARKREYIKTPAEREKRRIAQQKWRDANREHYNAWARANHAKHRHRPEVKAARYDYHLRSKYGITLAERDALERKQRGKCAICGDKEHSTGGRKKWRLPVDHDHATGKVRGLLCLRCNSRLGWYETHAAKIAAYLGDAE